MIALRRTQRRLAALFLTEVHVELLRFPVSPCTCLFPERTGGEFGDGVVHICTSSFDLGFEFFNYVCETLAFRSFVVHCTCVKESNFEKTLYRRYFLSLPLR